MNCWQDVTNSCRCHHNFKFSSNNLNDSGLEILNRTRVTRIKCSFLWIHGLFDLTENAPEVDQIWTHFPKSGGGISFVIGSRENCWKTAVEAYFWKVFKKKMTPNHWPRMTCSRDRVNGSNSNYGKLWLRGRVKFWDSVTKWITSY